MFVFHPQPYVFSHDVCAPSTEDHSDRQQDVTQKLSAKKPSPVKKAAPSNLPVEKTDYPSVKIHEDENDFAVALDIPGYEADNIEVAIDENGILSITGHRSNRLYKASFMKRFRLRGNGLDTDNFSADLTAGLLTVTLPKKLPVRRTVAIKSASSAAAPAPLTVKPEPSTEETDMNVDVPEEHSHKDDSDWEHAVETVEDDQE